MHYIILAITFLATFLAQLVTRSVSVVFEILTKKLLVVGAVLATLTVFVVGFYALIYTTISAISATTPPFFNEAASLVVPDNFISLASIYITARIARFGYEWNIKVLQWRL